MPTDSEIGWKYSNIIGLGFNADKDKLLQNVNGGVNRVFAKAQPSALIWTYVVIIIIVLICIIMAWSESGDGTTWSLMLAGYVVVVIAGFISRYVAVSRRIGQVNNINTRPEPERSQKIEKELREEHDSWWNTLFTSDVLKEQTGIVGLAAMKAQPHALNFTMVVVFILMIIILVFISTDDKIKNSGLFVPMIGLLTLSVGVLIFVSLGNKFMGGTFAVEDLPAINQVTDKTASATSLMMMQQPTSSSIAAAVAAA